MARLFILLNIFFTLFGTNTVISVAGYKPYPKPKPTPRLQSQSESQPQPLVLPVMKETTTGMYYTTVSVGKPAIAINLAICAGGAALWFHCNEVGYNSTTYSHVLCDATKCKQTHESGCSTCYGGSDPTCGKENVSTCYAFIPSHVIYYTTRGTLIEDNLILSSQSQLSKRLPMFCMSDYDIIGLLPKGSVGLIGLGNGSTSFVKTLVSTYKIPFKVALCLPSSKPGNGSGVVYIGGGPYKLPSYPKDVSKLLVSTPLINLMETREGGEDNYCIDLRSIQVNGETLGLNQSLLTFKKKTHWGGTKINTLIPYTILHTSIYKALVKAFAGNAKRRKAVAPFGDCFSAKSFGGKSLLEKETPVISLVLRGGVKWKIYGPNSLVKVKKSVVCLGFMDGGEDNRIAIEMGGYQMEDNLVEFDVETSKFSFTSSLLLHNTSCT